MKTFDVPIIYRSPLISAIKNKRRLADKLKKDFSPVMLDFGPVKIFLARHFGFCYGVENAIEIAFRTVTENPGKRIFLLSEMIHNPQVNDDLKQHGIQFLQDTQGNELISFEELNKNDIVIIPAFGTTIEIEKKLASINIDTTKYNTTCPFVEKVWNRSEAIAQKKYTIIIHGKPGHEETRATFSHAANHAPALVIKDMKQAILLAEYIEGRKYEQHFMDDFKGQYSVGFDVKKDLQKIGVVNQTTMLASDTQAIADFLKVKMSQIFLPKGIEDRFADTRDTLCYATNDNQSAVMGLLNETADLAIVVGGYKSSNTSHLVELCAEKLPTYFIESALNIISKYQICHFSLKNKLEIISNDYLPNKAEVKILLTSGASCPDALVEQVILKLISYFSGAKKMEEILESIEID